MKQVESLALAALEYLRRGWSVFPLKSKREPLVDWKQYQEKLPSQEQVRLWWTQTPDAWIGCALGKVSNLVRVDADGPQAVVELVRFGSLPETVQFSSPSGGVGWLLQHASGVVTEVLWTGTSQHEELRVQSNGAYTVLPPSPGYLWIGEHELAKIPAWLYSRGVDRELRKLEAEMSPSVADPDRELILEALRAMDPVRCDQYDSWVRVGIALHSGGDVYLTAWEDWSRGSGKFKEGECGKLWSCFHRNGRLTLRSVLHWAKEDGWKPPRMHEPLTDVGNGKILARLCQDKFKYVKVWESWVEWDSMRWKENAELSVVALMKDMTRNRFQRTARSLKKMAQLSDEDAKKHKLESVRAVLKWCHQSEGAGRIHAAVDMARSEPGIAVEHGVMDRYYDLFNCPNGTLEL